MKIKEALLWGQKQLQSANIPYYKIEAEALLENLLNKTKEDLLKSLEQPLKKNLSEKYQKIISKRAKGYPFFYLLGQREFFKYSFLVKPKVLIPRPETEILVETAIEDLKEFKNFFSKINIIDIGTGTGCIIISIFKELENFSFKEKFIFHGIDISKKAVKLALKNAQRLNANSINFWHGNLLKPLKDNSNYYFIVANLPYIKNEDYKKLPPEIQKFEPKKALWAGSDGLLYYKKLFNQIKKRKIRVLEILIEIDPLIEKNILNIIQKQFPKSKTTIINDLSQKPRICKIVFI